MFTAISDQAGRLGVSVHKTRSRRMKSASVVIPAHNEELSIERTLSALLDEATADELEIVVVANGCTDRTAEIARRFAHVQVVETPVPSKVDALRLGDEVVSTFPRFYVDADVVISTADLRSMSTKLAEPGVLAVGPRRQLPMDGVAWPVRWFYDVWQQLPGVSVELFGRGVIGVSADGHGRVRRLPDIMADDLVMAMAFEPSERVVVTSATSVIRPPRTYRDLVRRRVRAMTGNQQHAELAADAAGRKPPQTGLRDLLGLIARRPPSLPKVAVFVVTAVISRGAARRAIRRGTVTWLRDESSRTGQR